MRTTLSVFLFLSRCHFTNYSNVLDEIDEMDMNKEGQVCIEEWNEMKSKVEDDDVHRFKNKVRKSGVYIFSCPV